MRTGQTGHIAGVFDHRHLHAQADAKIGYLVLARVAHGGNLALYPALTETTGNENSIHPIKAIGACPFDLF